MKEDRLGDMDILSRERRSEVMSSVRSKGNKATELALVALFRKSRITGWRRGQKKFGRPDFVFPRARLAIFVDGCFWHGCPLHGSEPGTNVEFWKEKLRRNRERDRLVNETLKAGGWTVVRIWQHELRTKCQHQVLSRIRTELLRCEVPDKSRTGRYADNF